MFLVMSTFVQVQEPDGHMRTSPEDAELIALCTVVWEQSGSVLVAALAFVVAAATHTATKNPAATVRRRRWFRKNLRKLVIKHPPVDS
jgi:hypothetical protein